LKLASFYYRGRDRIGVEFDTGRIVDIADAEAATFPDEQRLPKTMKALLQDGDAAMVRVAEALAFVRLNPESVSLIVESEVRWLPPVPDPGKICGVAMNNSASNARKISAPEHPAFFLKPSSCLIGNGATIKIRSYYGSAHPEPELAVIIGKAMRDVDAENALDYVAGYTIFNDITGNGMRAEDLFRYWAIYAKADDPSETERIEQHLSYAGRYKGTDTFGILGPWLVTRDEVANPDDLDVHCALDDETIAEDSTRYYNYKVAEILSFINQFHTLHPGDVVSCGTAFKPAPGRKSIHNANFQQIGSSVSVSIDGLGTQRNPVEVEQREIGQWRLK
jgi:2-keto-4-pentenoate hydratase/2-oxohepta-3-ene-1,7-dioic acid hydratase in catechol pathway